jgi:small multidrug resistance pump
MKAWALLGIAIIFEIAGTSMLKLSDGFAKWHWAGLALLAYWVSFYFLAQTLTRIPVGIAYAVWSGVGIVIITLIGWALFKQSLSLAQIACIALIAIGAVGLNLATPTQPDAEVLG